MSHVSKLDMLADVVIEALEQPEVRDLLATQGLNAAPTDRRSLQAEAPGWAQLASREYQNRSNAGEIE